jgi:alpha-L-rhamnosidase
MARTASVLDNPTTRRFADLASRATAFRARFVKGGAHVDGKNQTAYVLALYTGMLDDDETERGVQHLLRRRHRNWHLSTAFSVRRGSCQSRTLPPTTRTLLMQESQPSWLFPVRNGATTMWERWDSWSLAKGFHSPFTTEGHRTVNMNSFNHYAYGCVGDWLYRVVGGIECIAPGYERVRIAPRPGAGLTWATTRYDSVRGPIACSWKIEDGRLRVTVDIPPTVTAEVDLPGQGVIEVGGHHEYTAALAERPLVSA